MHFLPDIFVECADAAARAYNRETLEIRYRGRSIADVLAMRVEEAIGFFDSFSNVKQHLRALDDVGLGVHRPGPVLDDALRRRGPARQARGGTGHDRGRSHALRPGRTHDRPAFRRHPRPG
jgi:hypothetical protein